MEKHSSERMDGSRAWNHKMRRKTRVALFNVGVEQLAYFVAEMNSLAGPLGDSSSSIEVEDV